jgi:glucose/arabinose dehydrogenase
MTPVLMRISAKAGSGSAWLLLLMGCTALAAVADPPDSDIGATPVLVQPDVGWVPHIKIAKARVWQGLERPIAAPGLQVSAFARGLDHPRWLYVLPNGDVLVAETNGPDRPDDAKGIKGWLQTKLMERAGATVPSAERITLLRDADHDGLAETRTVFLKGLHSPFGMALVGNTLFVANTDAIVSFPYTPGATQITASGMKVVALPAGTINHHWTKNIIASLDGRKYVHHGGLQQ